jgi:hypothetical protein
LPMAANLPAWHQVSERGLTRHRRIRPHVRSTYLATSPGQRDGCFATPRAWRNDCRGTCCTNESRWGTFGTPALREWDAHSSDCSCFCNWLSA